MRLQARSVITPAWASHRIVLEELTQATIGRPAKAGFSDLAGKWTPDPAFDEIIESQRKVDRARWK